MLSACTLFSYTPTPLPAAPDPQPTTSASAPNRAAAPTRSPRTSPPAPADAGDTAQRIHHGQDPKARPAGRRSIGRHLPAGSRNPFTGEIEGFDIDMVKAVAEAIFGDPDRYQLKVITAAQRIPALEKGDVDIVARNMTINCDRWKQIAFSTEYYRSGQKILVRKGSKANSINDLAGQKVCAPRGTSSMDNLIKEAPRPFRSLQTTTRAASRSSSRVRWRLSQATTPCSPGWQRRTRMRWCLIKRRLPKSRMDWASTKGRGLRPLCQCPAGRDACRP